MPRWMGCSHASKRPCNSGGAVGFVILRYERSEPRRMTEAAPAPFLQGKLRHRSRHPSRPAFGGHLRMTDQILGPLAFLASRASTPSILRHGGRLGLDHAKRVNFAAERTVDGKLVVFVHILELVPLPAGADRPEDFADRQIPTPWSHPTPLPHFLNTKNAAHVCTCRCQRGRIEMRVWHFSTDSLGLHPRAAVFGALR